MSILSHDHRFMFLHVAKTGGRSINLTLAKHCPRTARFNTKRLDPNVDVLGRRPAMEIRRHMSPEQWGSYFKFAFVRNPWDRAVSMYRHIRSSGEMNSRGKQRYLDEITKRLAISPEDFTFDLFVRAVLRDRIFDNYHWDKQVLSLTDSLNQPVFDYVGRFESLQSDFDFVCRRIGFPLTVLPHHNRTERLHYTHYYSPEIQRLVSDIYRDDVEMFGYSFGEENVESGVERPLASVRERLLSRVRFHGRESLRKLTRPLHRPALSADLDAQIQAASACKD